MPSLIRGLTSDSNSDANNGPSIVKNNSGGNGRVKGVAISAFPLYWHRRASYDAIEKTLETMRKQADEEGISSIAMPLIGAGYGGLSWKKVRPIIEQVFKDWPGTLYVYEEFVPGE